MPPIRATLEEVSPAIVDLRRGNDSRYAQQGEDKVHHAEDGCARLRAPGELHGSAGDDLRGTRDGLIPIRIMGPRRRDETGGERCPAKQMPADVRTRR